MITPKQQAKIDEIMDEFNFHKVHDLMVHLEWKWFGAEGGTPTPGDIRRTARNLLQDICRRTQKEPFYHLHGGSGGLSVRRWGGVDKFGPWENFSLSFQLEYWETEEDDKNTILNTIN
jgi:hypothetical protein